MLKQHEGEWSGDSKIRSLEIAICWVVVRSLPYVLGASVRLRDILEAYGLSCSEHGQSHGQAHFFSAYSDLLVCVYTYLLCWFRAQSRTNLYVLNGENLLCGRDLFSIDLIRMMQGGVGVQNGCNPLGVTHSALRTCPHN